MAPFIQSAKEITMLTLSIPDMSCAHCSSAITQAVRHVDPYAQIEFNMNGRQVSLATTASPEALIKALDDAGYPAQLVA
jgi:copper chaperone